jgi:hypothetical protein
MKYLVLIKVRHNPPVNCGLRSRHSERRAEEQSEFRHNGSKRNCNRNADLAVNAANLQLLDRRKPWKCSRSESADEAITAKNS